jgi:iron complex outermembrane receptor protein
LALIAAARADDNTATIEELKQLSFDKLLNIEVTTVSRSPEKLSEAASAIQVITHDDIRRFGAVSLPDALRLAGNLQVAQKGADSWAISARGFNTELANKLLVLIDGRAVYTPLYSGVFWDRQDCLLEDIDRIEVISGPGGTLWGANAVNGVINVISKRAGETQGLYAEAVAGSSLRSAIAARYGGRLAPNVFFRIYGKYTGRDDTELAAGTTAGDASRMSQGGFRVDAQTSPENTLTVQGDVFGNREDNPTAAPSRSSGGNILGRWSHSFASGSNMKLQVYYDRSHLFTVQPPLTAGGTVLAPAGDFADDLDTYDVDFQYHLPAGERHRIIWGLGWRFTHDKVQNSPRLGLFPPTLNQNLFSGFVQDEIQLRDQLALTLGTKLEHNDYTGVEFEPGVRLQWDVAPDHMLWTGVSRAVRTPSRIDRDSSIGSPPYFALLTGGADFSAETLVAYEAGWRGQFSRSVTAAASLFYNVYDDVRSTIYNPVTIFPLYFQNGLAGDTYGVELAADWQATARWRLHASYNLLRENLRIKPGQADINNARNETADPEQQFSLRSSLDLTPAWQLDAALRWVDSLPTNNSGAVSLLPAYTELDLRLAWRPSDRLELSLVGQNLLHDRHVEYRVSDAPDVAVERAFYGKIAWRF